MTEHYTPENHHQTTEVPKTRERLIEGHEIGVATATFYPTWEKSSDVSPDASVDQVRGDLALETIHAAIENGYQLAVVDGGSSPDFIEMLGLMGVAVEAEREKGMSASRRQAFEIVSEMDGVEVICWTEPEKLAITRDCIKEAVKPIIDGRADIVVPRRDDEAFATYPEYQVKFEKASNHLWNDILKRHRLLPEDAEELDAWIGPRLFKNDPDIVDLFMGKYEYTSDVQSGLRRDAPELWPNAIFLPLVAALHKGYRVMSVDIPYRHPASQTANEQDSEAFRAKRATQQENILKTTIHFIRHLEDSSRSRMTRA